MVRRYHTVVKETNLYVQVSLIYRNPKIHLFTYQFFLSLQPGMEPGDVIIILQEREHETFQRRGHDLICVYNLGLTEALCGFEFTVKQLDGRDLVIKNPPGKVIEPGNVMYIN